MIKSFYYRCLVICYQKIIIQDNFLKAAMFNQVELRSLFNDLKRRYIHIPRNLVPHSYVSKLALAITLGLMCTITSAYADTRVLILGDSLSASYSMQQNEGWVALLQNTFNSRKEGITLINASISGETTAGGLARLDKLLNKQNPDVVLIELGGNDGLRGFPVKKAKQNLLQMIEKVHAKEKIPLLMQIRIPPNYGPRYTKMFEGMYPKIAEQQKVTLLPFFMEEIAIEPELMLPDGIHPSKKAMPKISKFMDKTLLKALKEATK